MDERANEERRLLKRQILQAAQDHEQAPRQYIQQVRQQAIDDSRGGGGKGGARGNYNS